MQNIFFQLSKDIADKFIQSIIFVDDNAYDNSPSKNAFDATVVSNAFAKVGKICAIYAPSNTDEIKYYLDIFKKADVVILDWSLSINNKASIDPDDDADKDDPRGAFTIQMIDAITKDAGKEKLKLIIIYTAETDLGGITENIYNELSDPTSFKKNVCTIESKNIRISIRAKDQNNPKKFSYNENLKQFVCSYVDLPNLVTDEFTNLTNGLLPDFALTSISLIRDNISKIIGTFSSDLDAAYLGNKVLLKNPDDSRHLLIKNFGESLIELLENADLETSTWIKTWIIDHVNGVKNIKIGASPVRLNGTSLTKFVLSPKDDFKKDFCDVFKVKLSNNDIDLVKSNFSSYFSQSESDAKKSNIGFAKLTHHKNIFLPLRHAPFLTLGTIVKEYGSTSESYLVCIQQKCDSVRITDKRAFLFLPLNQCKGDYCIIIGDGTRLFVDKTSYSIQTITFSPLQDDTIIKAQKDKNSFFFKAKDGSRFEWVVDLKEMHAQRILMNYCSQLSRIGLDESEWLRLTAKNQ